MNHRAILAVILVALASVVACGGEEEDAPTVTPVPLSPTLSPGPGPLEALSPQAEDTVRQQVPECRDIWEATMLERLTLGMEPLYFDQGRVGRAGDGDDYIALCVMSENTAGDREVVRGWLNIITCEYAVTYVGQPEGYCGSGP